MTEPSDQKTASRLVPQAALRPDMTVRQVAYDFPACWEVFVRYGEPADRQPRGRLIPLQRFAQERGLRLQPFLEELAAAAGVPVDWAGYRNQTVHRPLLAGALVLGLSLGAGWGAYLLWQIGWAGSFQAAAVGHVIAHGEAQFWGFLVPFIAGIALRWLPTATRTPGASRGQVGLIGVGLLVGVVGGFAWAVHPQAWLGVVSASALVLAAGALASFLVARTATRLTQPWAVGVAAAGGWLCLWAGFTWWLRAASGLQGPQAFTEAQRAALIELALMGVAVNAVYGFGLRLLPGMVGGKVVSSRAMGAVGLHNGAAAVLLASTLRAWPVGEVAGWTGVLLATLLFVFALPSLYRPRSFSPRPEQGPWVLAYYVPLAVAWLIAGVTLLWAGQVGALWFATSVPHAWRGAARHALTVGFVSTLILGVGQRLVPILEHALLAWPRLALPILVLVASGNVWRVGTELATLWWPGAFRWMPFSALLELSALGLFSANLLRTMWPPADPLVTRGTVTPSTPLAVCLAEHPWLEDRMLAWGLDYLARTRSVPRELTLASLARSHGWEPAALVAAIQEALAEARPGGAIQK